MNCEKDKCTRDATIKDGNYHPDKWFCTYHANKAKKEGRLNKKLKTKTK